MRRDLTTRCIILDVRETPDWPVVGEFIFIESRFLKEWHDDIFP